MCDAGASDDGLRVDLGDAADLGGAGGAGLDALERMQAERAKRLEAMGASDAPPPPPSAPQRLSVFSVSGATDADRAKSEERLARMRAKDKCELEAPNADAIARALRGAKSWQDAGLHERAWAELQAVEKYCSYKSDMGASFHLKLADVAVACGRSAESRRLRQRVMKDARSSTQRWQAEQALAKGSSSSSAASAPSSPSNPELNSLFRMPSQWD